MSEQKTVAPLMAGKKGLIMGVANNRSIAWGIAQTLHNQGAELAFSYQDGAFGRRAVPLAESLGSEIMVPCDVEDEESLDNVFAAIKEKWGKLDFLVHAIAYSDPSELQGRFADTTRENFANSMYISCFSFVEVARRASELMTDGGSMITLSYGGSTQVVPRYNVMGVAKAALEASVRYLAADFGRDGIRVNSLSSGAMRTLSGAGIGDARALFKYQSEHAPMARTPTLDEIGGSALYLLSDLSGAVTGETHFVDCGFNIIGVPRPEDLAEKKSEITAKAAE